MEYNVDVVKSGGLDGLDVWICHYNHPDFYKQPLRSLCPTKVKVVSNDECSRRFYYSNSHFVKYNKNGKLSNTRYALFDNTGYRSLSGNPLNVFDNEVECIECWNSELESHLVEFDKYKSLEIERLDGLGNVLKCKLIGV